MHGGGWAVFGDTGTALRIMALVVFVAVALVMVAVSQDREFFQEEEADQTGEQGPGKGVYVDA